VVLDHVGSAAKVAYVYHIRKSSNGKSSNRNQAKHRAAMSNEARKREMTDQASSKQIK
jgi:hypothetical protein